MERHTTAVHVRTGNQSAWSAGRGFFNRALARMAQVLVVPILAGASGKAQVKPLTYVSALVALAGVGLLVEKGGVIMPGAGDLWSLLSAVFFGIQARPPGGSPWSV